ncbi:4'-phosphopantetheinyl transferase superfamily protein [Streptosporangium oxazolinicum]|uniref:4'-phosphopantetheinyl transferase superfamily protein n=1 Tax=Streptosporangium oxazolinicum TaxID=909287 RepID=A0ABP8B4C0_9ACTN
MMMSSGECHVWWAAPGDRPVESLVPVLGERELERAALFRREPDRRRFLTGSWLLRTVVAARLGIGPGDVVVDRSCPDCTRYHGKPRIKTDGPPLHVSVSHSGDRVVVALTAEGPLGVDVEAVPSSPVDGPAWSALTEDERSAVEALPPKERYEAFATVWVRKEAALKATGHGLRVPPGGVEVSGPSDDPELLGWPLDIPPGHVRLRSLEPGRGYVAALAVISTGPALRVVESRVAAVPGAVPSPAVRG